MFKYLNNTADIELLIKASDEEGLAAETISAFYNTVTNTKLVEKRQTHKFSIISDSFEQLLYDLLNELIYIFDTKKYLSSYSEVFFKDDFEIVVKLYGEPYEQGRHEIKKILKAVTLQGFCVSRKGDFLELHVIFDV